MKTDIPNGWWFHHLYRDNSKKRERPAERWHRDAKIFTLFDSTSKIQRMPVERAVTGLDVR